MPRRLRRQQLAAQGDHDRLKEVIYGYLGQRRSLLVVVADQVERDVEAARAGDYGVGVCVDGARVQRVHLRRLGDAACRAYLAGDGVEAGQRASRQVDRRALTRKRSRHRASNQAARAINDRALAVE